VQLAGTQVLPALPRPRYLGGHVRGGGVIGERASVLGEQVNLVDVLVDLIPLVLGAARVRLHVKRDDLSKSDETERRGVRSALAASDMPPRSPRTSGDRYHSRCGQRQTRSTRCGRGRQAFQALVALGLRDSEQVKEVVLAEPALARCHRSDRREPYSAVGLGFDADPPATQTVSSWVADGSARRSS
jgi:hypothetical protein